MALMWLVACTDADKDEPDGAVNTVPDGTRSEYVDREKVDGIYHFETENLILSNYDVPHTEFERAFVALLNAVDEFPASMDITDMRIVAALAMIRLGLVPTLIRG